jgi:hypothetical protein
MFSFMGGGITMTTSGASSGAMISRTPVNGPVTVNGVVYTGVKELEVRDGVVYLDGVGLDLTDQATGTKIMYKSLELIVTGDIIGNVATTTGKVSIGGNCVAVATASGSVTVGGNVEGGVSTARGDVNVRGRIQTGPRATSVQPSGRMILSTQGRMSPELVVGDLTYSDSPAPKRARPPTTKPMLALPPAKRAKVEDTATRTVKKE